MIKEQKSRGRRTKGVTLMEILVSMVILTVGVYMVYNIFPLGFAASWRSKNRTIATQLAQQKLEEILNNKYTIDCKSQHSATCLMRPLESDYDLYNDYSDSFDCRYFYGSGTASPLKDGTLDMRDSGDMSINSNWNNFAGNADYWYHVNITPVVDPAKKFRSVGDMVRITVTVRGPIGSMSDWAALSGSPSVGTNKRWDKLPVEVIVSTLKANRFLAYTTIDTTYNETGWHNGVFDNLGDGSSPDARTIPYYDPANPLWRNGRIIRVANIRNFTMLFNAGLSERERYDYGKVQTTLRRTGTGNDGNFSDDTDDLTVVKTDRGGNFYGLDNVIITRVLTQVQAGMVKKSVVNTQTAKVVRIMPDLSVNPSTTANIPGQLVLAQPLYVDRDMPSPNTGVAFSGAATRGLSAKESNHFDTSIVDVEKYLGTDIYSSTSACYQLMKSSYTGAVLSSTDMTNLGLQSRPSNVTRDYYDEDTKVYYPFEFRYPKYYYDTPYKGSGRPTDGGGVPYASTYYVVPRLISGTGMRVDNDASFDYPGFTWSLYYGFTTSNLINEYPGQVTSGNGYSGTPLDYNYLASGTSYGGSCIYTVTYYVTHLTNIKRGPGVLTD